MIRSTKEIIGIGVLALAVGFLASANSGQAGPGDTATSRAQQDVIYREDFDSDALSAHWKLKNPDSDAMVMDDGALVLLSEPGDWQQETVKNLALYADAQALPKNWRVMSRFSTEVLNYPGSGNETSWVGMVLYLDKDNLMEISVTGHCCGDRRSVQFYKMSKGQWLPGYEIQVGGADKQQRTYHLKIEKHGFSYSGAFSEDGKKWIPVGTHKFLGKKFTPGLYAVRHSRALETTSSFDWFQISE